LILSETGQEASDNGQEQPQRSAIVEPKKQPRNMMLAHLAHHRAGEKADELFREIVRRPAKRD
jgi:hypothetical protein